MVAANGFVLVTGGSRGIGAATARLAAERGSDVCIGYRDRADSADGVVADCQRIGVSALAVPVDVSQEQDVLRLFATAQEALGPLGALVNNAGVLDRQAPVADLQAARIERILAVNVLGAFLCAREAGEYVDYAASKAAVDALTVGLSREVADEGIRVNGVRPGLIDTDIHASGGEAGRVARMAASVPMKRGGTAEEVAEAILWLVSDQSSYPTGSIIEVSGGR